MKYCSNYSFGITDKLIPIYRLEGIFLYGSIGVVVLTFWFQRPSGEVVSWNV